jgi:hypothetical protein
VQLAVEALTINLGLGERQGVAASLVCLAQVADAQAAGDRRADAG